VKETEIIPLEDALNRVLGEDIIAKYDIPPFDRAAMDGYAVRSMDVISASEDNPIALKVVGEARIGYPYRGVIGKEEAVKIDTGAKLPEGADAVIPIEYVNVIGNNYVEVLRAVTPFDNVSKKGEDVKRGTIILKAGILLEPWDLALIKSVGYRSIKVLRRVRVALMSVGDELIEGFDETTIREGKIIDTNRFMIKSALKKFGCEVVDLGIARDDINEIKEKMLSAMKYADMLITIGGTSVGERDYVPQAINLLGKPGIIIHGITASPGRPLALSIINDFPIVSLPGFPVAALIDFMIFVPPIIEKILGIRGERILPRIKAKLGRRVFSKPGVRHYVRVKLSKVDDELIAEPIRITGSGILSSIVRADGILEVPEDLEGYEKGTEVDVILLRNRIGDNDEEDL